MTNIRRATYADRPAILALIKKCPYTSMFSAPMHSAPEVFESQPIAIAETEEGDVVGFIAGRNKQREPHTMLYFISVRKDQRRGGLGRALVDWALDQSPHGRVRVHIAEGNETSRRFSLTLGFKFVGTTRIGKAKAPTYVLELTRD